MSEIQKDQIEQWLKKLERESWQLELLVSAFTIFLLIQAIEAYSIFIVDLPYRIDVNRDLLAFLYVFLGLIELSLKALTIFLVIHLMLRGFWIGTIGLRSVQSQIDFSKLKFSDFFIKKLKKRIVSLDDMVILLDEMCSVIFSFSFLVISVIIAFGLYVVLLGVSTILLNYGVEVTSGWISTVLNFTAVILAISFLISGLIYMIDYFTLGFFKKVRWFSRIYYPIYVFYGVVTLSIISRSIYYYLISKYSKKKIRVVFAIFFVLFFFSSITEYDQYQYFSDNNEQLYFDNKYYDNLRSDDLNLNKVSIDSHVITGPFLQLFIRYHPQDNVLIREICPDFEPVKEDGLNLTLKLELRDKGVSIEDQTFAEEDSKKILDCLNEFYQIHINDSLYDDPGFYFYLHPNKNQKGLFSMIPTNKFIEGQNRLVVKRVEIDEGERSVNDYATVPFWYAKE